MRKLRAALSLMLVAILIVTGFPTIVYGDDLSEEYGDTEATEPDEYSEDETEYDLGEEIGEGIVYEPIEELPEFDEDLPPRPGEEIPNVLEVEFDYHISSDSVPAVTAQDGKKTYKVTDKITATLQKGVLTITGTGEMPSYTKMSSWNTGEDLSQYPPWYNDKDQITTVVVGEGITNIGGYAFNDHYSLSSVSMPDSITRIEPWAFGACTSLRSIELPPNVLEINWGAFGNNPSLESIKLNDKCKKIYDSVFWGASIKHLVLPAELEYLNESALGSLELETISIASSNKYLKTVDNVLYSKDGTTLILYCVGKPDTSFKCTGVKRIENYAFAGARNLKNIDLNGVEQIGAWALEDTGIRSLVISDSVKQVDSGSFGDNDYLTSVTFGKGLKSLAMNLFIRCNALESITIPETVEDLGSYTFSSCQNLKTVNLNGGGDVVAYSAFINCPSLTTVNFREGIKEIVRTSFVLCPSLKSVTMPNSVDRVQEKSFDDGVTIKRKNPALIQVTEGGGWARVNDFAVTGTRNYTEAFNVLKLVNQERAKNGLAALKMDAGLLETAMQRAAEQTINFSHTRPNSFICFTANKKMSAENVAYGQSSASGVMNSWMNSSGHKANILDGNNKSIGIGCFECNGEYFWTQVFSGESISSDCAKPANAKKSELINIFISNYDEGETGTGVSWSFGGGGVQEDYAHTYSLSKSSIEISQGKSATITLSVTNGSSKWMKTPLDSSSVKWSSSDTSVATVKNGKITAVGKGTCTISAASSYRTVATCTVTVKGKTGLYKNASGQYEYFNDGVFQKNYTGLYEKEPNVFYGLKNGVWVENWNGLYLHSKNGRYYFLENGVWKRGFDGLYSHSTNGKTYYLSNGIWQKGYLGLWQNKNDGGKYYYLNNGLWQKGYDGLYVHSKNKWTYYLRNGIWNRVTEWYKHSSNGLTYYIETGLWRGIYKDKNGVQRKSTNVVVPK